MSSCPHTCIAPAPTTTVPYQSVMFVTINESILTRHYHRVHSLHQGILLGLYNGFDKHIMTCIHYYSLVQSIFIALKILWASPIHFSLHTSSPGNHGSFYCLHTFIFSRMSQNQNPTVLAFSLRYIHLSSLHVFSLLNSAFFFSMNNVCLCHSLFSNSSTVGHLVCIYVLAITNKAGINIHDPMLSRLYITPLPSVSCSCYLKSCFGLTFFSH